MNEDRDFITTMLDEIKVKFEKMTGPLTVTIECGPTIALNVDGYHPLEIRNLISLKLKQK